MVRFINIIDVVNAFSLYQTGRTDTPNCTSYFTKTIKAMCINILPIALQFLTIASQNRAKMVPNVDLLIGEATYACVNPDTLDETAAVSQTITYQLLAYNFLRINSSK